MRSDTTYQHVVGIDGKLSVSVWNHENMSIGSLFGISNSNEVYGRRILVDINGDAMLPKLVKVTLAGLTILEVNDTLSLSQLYSKILVAPIIVVKVQKRAISILEEVSAPGKYILEKETNILTELLATAQGFEFYADKENILLLRSNKTYRIDFTVLENNNYRSKWRCY